MTPPGNDVSDSASQKGAKMAAKKDVCPLCSDPFYWNQQYLNCCACLRRYHCKCINVRGDDYNLFMAEGVSSYKCHSCSKRRDPDEAKLNATAADTPQKDAMKDGEE
ncbi:hypothetical protein HPB47_015633 [Ixodes persulcatus]|uniref:Uncharacterized protein n=1 Tax=Ixodes persulcatus TaxID=34615 RepID=A0AC60QSY9_IXOPE|nr:hypothetical protein HPB47_015633 [Ixodes persulcatus]